MRKRVAVAFEEPLDLTVRVMVIVQGHRKRPQLGAVFQQGAHADDVDSIHPEEVELDECGEPLHAARLHELVAV